MTRTSTITYWALAALFAVGLAMTLGHVMVEGMIHWRFGMWWGALLVAHLARLALVPLLYLGLLVDGFDGMMSFLYAMQPTNLVTITLLIAPLLPLALGLYVWRRGHYKRLTPSKGETNGIL